MKAIGVAAALLLLLAPPAFAQSYVRGYCRKDGRCVSGYMRSNRDSTVTDNYSFSGNTNPYTGTIGSNRYTHDETSPYFDSTPYGDGHYGHSGAVFGY